jgi:hypothetical protein
MTPFLTALDERARVKGSRDPLGLVPVWSRFGRDVVGNLTTVTGSVRGFTTLLVGLELADRLQEQLGHDAPNILETFLRFEQIAAYARVKVNGDRDIRGTLRVAKRLNEGKRIRISARTDDQILANQKTYGLWGLFTSASRESGLVADRESRLEDGPKAFVDRMYLAVLGKVGLRRLLDILRRESFDLQPDGRDADIFNGVAKIHARRLRAEERAFYREHLAWCMPKDPTAGRQRQLSEALVGVGTKEFGFPEFRAVQKSVRRNPDLSAPLMRIGNLESLIAPAALVFGFLQDRDGQTIQAVDRQMREAWNRAIKLDLSALANLKPRFAAALQSEPEADLWMHLAKAFTDQKYAKAVELLVAINTAVMQRRQGAASWIALENGRIRVRLADEPDALVPVEEAENRWRSTYFINSLWSVSKAVTA